MTAQRRHPVEWAALAVAAVTVLAGLGQLAAPAAALGSMGVDAAPATVLFFSLVSLLTATFGAAMLHTVWTRRLDRAVVFWAGVAKLWGPLVIALGVARGTLGSAALLVAGYDFAAGVFVLWYATTLHAAAPGRAAAKAVPG